MDHDGEFDHDSTRCVPDQIVTCHHEVKAHDDEFDHDSIPFVRHLLISNVLSYLFLEVERFLVFWQVLDHVIWILLNDLLKVVKTTFDHHYSILVYLPLMALVDQGQSKLDLSVAMVVQERVVVLTVSVESISQVLFSHSVHHG